MSKKDRQTESLTVEDRAEQTPTLTAESPDPVVDANTASDEPAAPPVVEEPPVVAVEAPPVVEQPAPVSPYAAGDLITLPDWGRVQVLAVHGDHIDVRRLRTGTCKSIKVD